MHQLVFERVVLKPFEEFFDLSCMTSPRNIPGMQKNITLWQNQFFVFIVRIGYGNKLHLSFD
jgi:hypothetical protein